MIKISIVGATGYTGLEILKILSNHPKVEIKSLKAVLDKNSVYIDDIFPSLKGKLHKLCYNFLENKIEKDIDVVFLAVPHTVSQKLAPLYLKNNIKVIDLSADYRLKSVKTYEKWYKTKHTSPNLIKNAVYGLPEINKSSISKAQLIANPGCYPTGILLGILPALKLLSGNSIFVNSSTGTSGAGRKAILKLLFSECSNNMRSYKVLSHQHQPEIEQIASDFHDKNVNISFVPNVVPVERGILSTVFIPLKSSVSAEKAGKLYSDFYKDSPFVKLLTSGTFPESKNVIYSNYCHIGLKPHKKQLVVVTAIDNLLKGAAGQAVQNMNIMFSFDETEGLK